MKIPKGIFRDIIDDLGIFAGGSESCWNSGLMLKGLGLGDGASYGQLTSVTQKELTWASPVSNLLRLDHRTLEREVCLLRGLVWRHPDEFDPKAVSEKVEAIRPALESHLAKEERVFFKSVRPYAADLVDRMESAHGRIREAGRLLAQPASMEEMRAVQKDFQQAVMAHFDEEERELLRWADLELSVEDGERLAALMKVAEAR